MVLRLLHSLDSVQLVALEVEIKSVVSVEDRAARLQGKDWGMVGVYTGRSGAVFDLDGGGHHFEGGGIFATL